MEEKNIDLTKIHSKWQKKWQETNIYTTKEDFNKPKYYVLDMFPYPSWAWLHVWHPKWYIATDTISRKKMLEWYNILHPMGWDAFWLPAEQYAIKNKLNPKIATDQNIARYKQQLEMFGFSYDWNREISTTDPEFYKWTQWTFIQFYSHYFDENIQKARPIWELELKIKTWELKIEWDVKEYVNSQRLAYVDFKPINWCPSCKTWLANEDLEDWKCERCGSEIERKPMRQWVIRITKYAERLLEWLQILPEWVENIKEMQKNWIWKSVWTQFDLKIAWTSDKLSVFTTRVDTVFGMSFVAIAPEHSYISRILSWEIVIDNLDEVLEYVESAKKKTDLQRTDLNKDKTWVEIKWIKVINPFNEIEIPLFVADYVLVNYGTWVVMAVPAHDERDFEFAQKYNLPIKQSIAPFYWNTAPEAKVRPEKNTLTRAISYSIVYNPKTDKYLILELLTWEKWQSFVVWWIEDWEDPIQASIREIYEETWYKNLRFIRQVTWEIHAYFFAIHKDENRYSKAKTYLFELIDDQQDSIDPKEAERQRVVWLSKDEVDIKFHNQKYAWDQFINWESAYTEYGVLVDSGKFTWLKSEEAKEKMNQWLEQNWLWYKKVNYKIQDWVFSRQRYWWEPIPMITCQKCWIVPMNEKELPLLLPQVENYEPTGTQEWPLAAIDQWINVKCPICWQDAKRESNTMPQWAWSSWYYLRYMDPNNSENLVDKDIDNYWNQVDVYVWWAEHATRHLIYARFWHKFLYDLGIVSTQEPMKKLQNVWMILAEDWRKMSKRWGNVINPDDVVNEYWADTMRIYEMFMWPFDQAVAWNTNWVKWAKRFLEKIIWLLEKIDKNYDDNTKIQALLHKTIKKVTYDIDEFRYNTAVSQMMILVNTWEEESKINKESFEKFIVILSPFAPHLAEELWERLWNEYSIFTKAIWPKYDENIIALDLYMMPIQINWKLRDSIEVNKDISEQELMWLIQTNSKLQKYFEWNSIKKIIFVPWKIINIII